MSRTLKRPHGNAFPTSNTPYGTPLPDPHDKDSGEFLPVWKQSAVDERGRKRFHGAFTGGFSAGYFNSVGSKEGFVPTTFVSSRNARVKAPGGGQKVEDFMDDEDVRDKEEEELLAVSRGYAGLGVDEEGKQELEGGLLGLITVERKESVGIKLLAKMGWRQGQGIGPKVKRATRGEDGDSEEHWFAPDDTKVLELVKKIDRKGLGFDGISNGASLESKDEADEEDDSSMLARSKSKFGQPVAKSKKASFGVGVLNDTGSDDEDPYSVGPKISYNKTIGGKKAKRLLKPQAPAANPLVSVKPIFTSKKKITSMIRKCHDGKLPLDGFILSTSLVGSTTSNHPPPPVPENWKSSKIPLSESNQSNASQLSIVEASKQSTLDPRSRGAILGEIPLLGKSIFSYLTPAARDRIANLTGKGNLPAAGSEAPPPEYNIPESERQRSLWDLVPQLDADLAKSALSRSDGFMPYADDAAKRARYVAFLEISAGMRTGGLPERAKGHSIEEWSAEMSEFSQAAQVFRPMTGLMASRFTSSSGNFEGGSSDEPLLRAGTKKDEPKDPSEEAARLGMFGTLTRSVQRFQPSRLVCKRLGIPVPEADDLLPDDIGEQVDMPVSQYEMDKMMRESLSRMGPISVASREPGFGDGSWRDSSYQNQEKEEVNVEKNDALETERPGDDIFKAIFGDDDDDE
jgi:G patch domain-containing protein 1